MSIGSKIQELIKANIETFHKDTLVRSNANISLEEKAKLFLEARVFNRKRNEVRDQIDQEVGDNSCSTKVNYTGEKQ